MREDGEGDSEDLWAEGHMVPGSWPCNYLREEHSGEREPHVQQS